MHEKNSKDRLGMGLKKIYFILCGVFALMLLIEIRNHAMCLDSDLADLCYVSYGDTLSDTIIQNLIIFLITTVPIYYIVRWIYLGFRN
tara:strand:+ start:760 stop:1023 length:264 start_codon:yes stop_codon:yes gene_type:complete